MAVSEVAVTGIGVVLPGCSTPSGMWDHFASGSTQISLGSIPGIDRKVPAGRTEPLSEEEFIPEIPAKFFIRYPLDIQLYLASVVRALRQGGIDIQAYQPERIGIFDGTSRGSFSYWVKLLSGQRMTKDQSVGVPEIMFGTPGQAASIAASLFRIEGPVMTLSTTCTSGAVAIGQACREIAAGNVDIALASGHEAPINPALIQTYLNAGLMSIDDTAAPSGENSAPGYSGIILGEGAVTLILESPEHARQRGANIYALISGYEHGNMGQHPTHVDPTGDRAARMIRSLLEKTGYAIDEVGAVFGHGNGRQISDASERNYMKKVFGDHEPDVPLYSLKPVFGHLIGASSALNVAAAIVLASGNHHPGNAVSVPAGSPANMQSGDCVLAVAYGIGGHCTVIAVSNSSDYS